MHDFAKELAGQLGARWLSLLALPGALYMALCFAAVELGQAHALSVHRLVQSVSALGRQASRWPSAAQAVALVAILLGAAAVGLLVQALAGPVRALCLGQWPRVADIPARFLTRRRRDRWRELLRQRYELEERFPKPTRADEQQRRVNRIASRVNAIALAEPARPTWMGDRLHALGEVAVNRYGLDLTFGWSRLWLVLPDSTRSEMNDAQSAFASSVFVATWSLPYIGLAVLWWPAAVIAVVVAVTGWLRARTGIGSLSDLAEAALDIHGRDLAIALGVASQDSTGPLSPDEGQIITDLVRKGR